MTKIETCLISFLGLTCSGLFLYKALECIIAYRKFETVSKNTLKDQQLFPLPSICVASEAWVEGQLQIKGLNKKEYKQGGWTFPNWTEEELYDFVSPTFEDLVTRIIARPSLPNTDKFKTINIWSNMSALEMKKLGMTVTRADFHAKLKVYCMEFSYTYGLQRVAIFYNNNTEVTFSVSPPKSYNNYERLRNEMLLVPGHKYTYQVYHTVQVSLPLSTSPCTHDNDFLEDLCRNDYINRLNIQQLKMLKQFLKSYFYLNA